MTEPLDVMIKKTQELLQPLIAKPKLAEKLLQKPPFRFLHDIFTALINGNAGFAKGLYNDFEMDSANIKEKNQKTNYLDKMIMFVGICAGHDLDVRSSKIVAGLEPENTNLLLIELAKAATNGAIDWQKAVQKTLSAFPSPSAGNSAMPTPATTPSADAKAGAKEPPPERPPSKESSSIDADRAAADKAAADKAAAEAKAKERARREKEENERREREQRAEAQRKESEEWRARNEAKQEATAPLTSRPSSRNNDSKAGGGSTAPATSEPAAVVASAHDPATLAQMIRDVNGADFDKTKDWIEKLITKPKMATKLLSKPPFRFLHDAISEIIRVTGFADGLYTAEEMDSANIKEKQPKMDYLTKIITCVSMQLQVEVEAKPAKIVAGLEPEETNKFLQLLAIACRSGTSRGAVDRTLAKLSGGGGVAVEVAEAKQNRSADLTKAAPSAAAAVEPAVPEAKASARAPPVAEAKAPRAESPAEAPPAKGLAAKGELVGAAQDQEPQQKAATEEDPSGTAPTGNMMQMAPGTSARTSSRAGATTARKRPPKRKENVTEAGRFLVNEAKTAAPTLGIMVDGDNKDDDDDPDSKLDGGLDAGSGGSGSSRGVNLSDDKSAHGKLVRDILNEEKKQQQANDNDQDGDNNGPMLPSEAEGIRFGKRSKSLKSSKGGASTESEMKELRDAIQKLCQAANPIGKCIEFVHEDLEAMQKEFEKWKKEFEAKVDIYEEEKKKTEESLQPLQVQLLEVEEQIKEQVHKINTIKATIARNEEKTQKLLRMVVSA